MQTKIEEYMGRSPGGNSGCAMTRSPKGSSRWLCSLQDPPRSQCTHPPLRAYLVDSLPSLHLMLAAAALCCEVSPPADCRLPLRQLLQADQAICLHVRSEPHLACCLAASALRLLPALHCRQVCLLRCRLLMLRWRQAGEGGCCKRGAAAAGCARMQWQSLHLHARGPSFDRWRRFQWDIWQVPKEHGEV